MAKKLFCERNALFYRISLMKERLLRRLKHLRFQSEGGRFARQRNERPLPNLVKAHRSVMVRQLHGVDPVLQQNKVKNLQLAAAKVNGLLIHPGETFSFWETVGPTSARQGYLEGMTISHGASSSGVGGGICQLANLIHWMALHSPLTVTELHHHTDALFPDSGRRVPFGTGVSVFYSNVDYQFQNTTDQTVQLRVWIQDGDLCGELCSEIPFPYRYRIIEENHCFIREGNDYFRVSQVYRLTYSRSSGELLQKELVLDNHSRVLYDPSLIPPSQLRSIPGDGQEKE